MTFKTVHIYGSLLTKQFGTVRDIRMVKCNYYTVLCLTLYICVHVTGRGSYTNFVNQEKLYTLEDELIALSEVIVNMERVNHGDEDVHDLYTITSVIEKTKSIHRHVVDARNMSAYISHPVNIYHMTKRLVQDWSGVVKRLKDSKSCIKAMQVKVQNIEDNIPNQSKLTEVIESLLRLQTTHALSPGHVIYWNISGSLPLSPLSLDDAFEISQTAYETRHYRHCIEWLDYIISNHNNEHAAFNMTNALSLLSSAHFMMVNKHAHEPSIIQIDRPHEAIVNLDKILQIDPDNSVAKRNKVFIEERMKEGQTDKPLGPTEPRIKRDRDIVKMCGQRFKQNTTRHTRLFCTYTKARDAGYFTRPSIQTEVLSLKPTILMFYNMTTSSQQKAVSHLGYERMRDRLSKNIYKYPDGIESTWLLDSTRWQWIPNMKKSLEAIALSHLSPGPSVFMIQNVGMDGYEINKSLKREKYQLGTFLVFLNDVQYGGGEIIFPDADIKVKPTKGSVLFFDVKAKRKATVCPVLAEPSWTATYLLMDQMASEVCYKPPILRPKYN